MKYGNSPQTRELPSSVRGTGPGCHKKSHLYLPPFHLPGLSALLLLCDCFCLSASPVFLSPSIPGFRLPSGCSRTSWKHIAQLSESSGKRPCCVWNSTHDFQLERREKSVAGAAAPWGGCCLLRLSSEETLGCMVQEGNILLHTTLHYNPHPFFISLAVLFLLWFPAYALLDTSRTKKLKAVFYLLLSMAEECPHNLVRTLPDDRNYIMIIQARVGCGPGSLSCFQGFLNRLWSWHSGQAWRFKVEDPSLVSIQAAIKKLNDSKWLACQRQRLIFRVKSTPGPWIIDGTHVLMCSSMMDKTKELSGVFYIRATTPFTREAPWLPSLR